MSLLSILMRPFNHYCPHFRCNRASRCKPEYRHIFSIQPAQRDDGVV